MPLRVNGVELVFYWEDSVLLRLLGWYNGQVTFTSWVVILKKVWEYKVLEPDLGLQKGKREGWPYLWYFKSRSKTPTSSVRMYIPHVNLLTNVPFATMPRIIAQSMYLWHIQHCIVNLTQYLILLSLARTAECYVLTESWITSSRQ